MQTSVKNKSAQQGVTLIELLISLAVLSLMVGISAIWLSNSLPSLAVRSAVSLLETDLKQARLRARTTGQAITLTTTQTGYAIEDLRLSRDWQRGIEVDWKIALPFFFDPGAVGAGGSIIIRKGGVYGEIKIDPYTGQISKS